MRFQPARAPRAIAGSKLQLRLGARNWARCVRRLGRANDDSGRHREPSFRHSLASFGRMFITHPVYGEKQCRSASTRFARGFVRARLSLWPYEHSASKIDTATARGVPGQSSFLVKRNWRKKNTQKMQPHGGVERHIMQTKEVV